jgi:hypothetical protein
VKRDAVLLASGILLLASGACSDPEAVPDPSLVFSSDTMAFRAIVGGSAVPAQVIMVGYEGGGLLPILSIMIQYAAGEPAGWLHVDAYNTAESIRLTLGIIMVPAPGAYHANVVLQDNESTAERSLPVSFTVEPRGSLYVIRDSDDLLQRIDPLTLVITDVGPLGIEYDHGDCAWHSTEKTLYAADGQQWFHIISLTEGTATPAIGARYVSGPMRAVAFDSARGSLYGVHAAFAFLYSSQVARFGWVGVGPLGGDYDITGLVWDPVTGDLLGADSEHFYLLHPDYPHEDQAIVLAPKEPTGSLGLTYDPVIDRFWAVDDGGNLFQYDRFFNRTTLATGIGPHTCIAYVP